MDDFQTRIDCARKAAAEAARADQQRAANEAAQFHAAEIRANQLAWRARAEIVKPALVSLANSFGWRDPPGEQGRGEGAMMAFAQGVVRQIRMRVEVLLVTAMRPVGKDHSAAPTVTVSVICGKVSPRSGEFEQLGTRIESLFQVDQFDDAVFRDWLESALITCAGSIESALPPPN